jgi:hypothetical protein
MRNYGRTLVPVVGLLIGAALGYLLASTKSKALEKEIAQLQTKLKLFDIGGAQAPSTVIQSKRENSSTSSISAVSERPADLPTSRVAAEDQRDVRMRQRTEKFITDTAASRDLEYTRVLSELGVKSADVQRFKSHLVDLHRRAVEAGDPLSRLMKERYEYDQAVKSTLSDEGYFQYRNFEEGKPAREEYKMLENFALKEKSTTLDPNYANLVAQLIKDTGATAVEFWEGPYDPVPRPTFGKEAFTNAIAQRKLKLESSLPKLVEALNVNGIPDDYRQIVAEYYTKQISDTAQRLAFYSRPDEEIHAERLAQSEERWGAQKQQSENQRKVQDLRQRLQATKP